MPTVGQNLKDLREGQGLTQEEVAERCHVKQTMVSRWESGKQEPTVESLLKLAVGLGQPIEAFVTGVNRAFDLACQKRDQESGHSEGAHANVPAAARVELQRLRDLVARYEKEAREVRTVTDSLVHVALALEEIRKAPARKTGSRGRDRKVG